jgi:hypothetical protein
MNASKAVVWTAKKKLSFALTGPTNTTGFMTRFGCRRIPLEGANFALVVLNNGSGAG